MRVDISGIQVETIGFPASLLGLTCSISENIQRILANILNSSKNRVVK